MVRRNVVWTKTADLQFVGILEYWNKRNRSNSYSKKLVRLVTQRTRQIAKNPFIYKSTVFKDIRCNKFHYFWEKEFEGYKQ